MFTNERMITYEHLLTLTMHSDLAYRLPQHVTTINGGKHVTHLDEPRALSRAPRHETPADQGARGISAEHDAAPALFLRAMYQVSRVGDRQ